MKNDMADVSDIEARYERAQTLMQGFWSRNLVPNSTVYPIWIERSDCFWYERELNAKAGRGERDAHGFLPKCDREYRLVNAAAATNEIAFDHGILASSLAEMAGQAVDKQCLPIRKVKMSLEPASRQLAEVSFSAFDRRWCFNPVSGALSEKGPGLDPTQYQVSPDGKKALFTRDYNLWLKDLEQGEERALTEDGEALYCYAVSGNGWGYDMTNIPPGPQARWSADSKTIFTVQRDCRQVKTLPVVEHVPKDGSIRPKLSLVSKPMQGDEHVPEYRLLAIHVDTGRVQAANYGRVPIVRNSFGFFSSRIGWWGKDNRHAYFVDLARDYRSVRVVEFDTTTGATRVLFEETSETNINLMLNGDDYPTYVALPETDELVWFSERSGWAHIYLYDLKTGALKNTITSGDWVVRCVLQVDSERREAFVQTAGRAEQGTEADLEKDPYYRDLIRVHLDTGEITPLVTGDFDVATTTVMNWDFNVSIAMYTAGRDIAETQSVSPSGNYAVATRSRTDSMPLSLLVDRDGREVLTLEKTDLALVHALVSPDWKLPEPVKLLAADGKTPIYGLIFRPTDFDPKQSYPIISHAFNCPEMPWVPKGSFSNDGRSGRIFHDASALAELGFIVVQIDGRGLPYRSKAFQDESYGWAEAASCIDDHIAGIQQLATRYPYMDSDRVGIYSMVGGTGAAHCLLGYPEFFKVGVSGLLHDARTFPPTMWGDKYEGIEGPNPDRQYPEELADRLQGKLFMAHGMLDTTTQPSNTFRIVEALQKANKDFDLLLLPNVCHGTNDYVVRRFWDYMVQHLRGVEPPKEFPLKTLWGDMR